MAWPSLACQCLARPGLARSGQAWPGQACMPCPGLARSDQARRQPGAKHGQAPNRATGHAPLPACPFAWQRVRSVQKHSISLVHALCVIICLPAGFSSVSRAFLLSVLCMYVFQTSSTRASAGWLASLAAATSQLLWALWACKRAEKAE